MSFIRNFLALVGLLALILGGIGYYQFQKIAAEFDPGMAETYWELGEKLLETRNSAEATVWRRQVDAGISAETVEETMKFIANEHNIAAVGELPLYQDIAAKTGKPYRFAKIFMFCNSLIAAQMLDYSDAFGAYLPCRIALIEDKQGKLWLITLNMDMMIHGGAPLPTALKAEAIKVKETILDIMDRGAKGAF